MFDNVGESEAPEGAASSLLEHGLAALLERLDVDLMPQGDGELYVVDVICPGLRSGVQWVRSPRSRHEADGMGSTRTADPGPRPDVDAIAAEYAELRRVLDAGVEPLARAAAATRAIARLSAVVATALAEFARCRPAALLDRRPGEQGAMSAATRAARPAVLTEVSEWAVDEVAPTLRISTAAASAQLVESLVLVERLPRTLALLARGELTPAHARRMVDVVGPVEDGDLRADIETHVLGLLGSKTPPQLGDCARRIMLRKDADAAARKLVAAVRQRGVRLHDRRDGTGTVAIDLPLPAAAAIYRSLEAYAEQARVDGDERTKQQRMADCLQDLVLRPGEYGMPPVTIALTLVATLETMLGGGEPGQVEGHLVPAEMVRELGYAFGLMPRPEPQLDELEQEPATEANVTDLAATGARIRPPGVDGPDADLPDVGSSDATPPPARPPDADRAPAPPGDPASPPPAGESSTARAPGTTPVADRTLTEWLALAAARHEVAVREGLAGAARAIRDGVWTDGELRSVLDLGALIGLRDVSGTGLAHRPHIAIVDQLRGSLVALTDAAAVRRGEALGPPPETVGYTPGAELDRFVRLRDRRCRFPGCRARARTCDLDHRKEWPAGPTAHHNLCCQCEHHHRLKHQAPGWSFDEADDGGLAITMPNGEVLLSHAPRFGTDLDLPPF
ncbi:HNH endonuclease signature motif containing protein [Blastococcus capsensis]|uniref:HNH endonuclease signature motif containing protein n=1 Tax=Blastococcus capsensis TaxID=1564163 RepID=UPI00253F98EC|nr:HNH endonuclease signature motif containing protein [Blastococcus capsensis]MDK3258700.1 DUF222 domain-containing protein [Blastococcus capsensis]